MSGIARGKHADDRLAEQSVAKGSNTYQACLSLGLLEPHPSPLVLPPVVTQGWDKLVHDQD